MRLVNWFTKLRSEIGAELGYICRSASCNPPRASRDSDDAVTIDRRNAGQAYVKHPTQCGEKGEKKGKPLTITSISPIIVKSSLARIGSSILDDGSMREACLKLEVLSCLMALD